MVTHAARTVALAAAAAVAALAVLVADRTVGVDVAAGVVLAVALMVLAHCALRIAEDPAARKRGRGPGLR